MLKIGEEVLNAVFKAPVPVTSERDFNTVYTNNKNYPIQVIITLNYLASTSLQQTGVFVNGERIMLEYSASSSTEKNRDMRTVSFTVPIGATYELVPGGTGEQNIFRWCES